MHIIARFCPALFLLVPQFATPLAGQQTGGRPVTIEDQFALKDVSDPQISPDARLYDSPEQQSPFHYGPAKAGLEQLTRHLAAELGPEKIRVNALVPGPFPQPGKMPAGLEDRLASRTMLRRIGRAEEIGGALLFLAAPASTFVTGSCLKVDGGWTAW